jgi:hypothetical protein
MKNNIVLDMLTTNSFESINKTASYQFKYAFVNYALTASSIRFYLAGAGPSGPSGASGPSGPSGPTGPAGGPKIIRIYCMLGWAPVAANMYSNKLGLMTSVGCYLGDSQGTLQSGSPTTGSWGTGAGLTPTPSFNGVSFPYIVGLNGQDVSNLSVAVDSTAQFLVITKSSGTLPSIPSFFAVYVYHGAGGGGNTVAPAYPTGTTPNSYAYSLTAILSGRYAGIAAYPATSPTTIYIGGLTGNVYSIGNYDVNQSYIDKTPSLYVDLYYF